MDRRLQFANVTTTIYRANGSGPTVLHRGQNIFTKQETQLFDAALHFYNLNSNRHSLNLRGNILYRCFETENNMDDGKWEKELEVTNDKSIYCTPSQITWFHILKKIHSFTSIGTALLYTKNITRGLISSHH